MATAKITRKGQITIPVEVRKHLGLEEGDEVSGHRTGIALRQFEPHEPREPREPQRGAEAALNVRCGCESS